METLTRKEFDALALALHRSYERFDGLFQAVRCASPDDSSLPDLQRRLDEARKSDEEIKKRVLEAWLWRPFYESHFSVQAVLYCVDYEAGEVWSPGVYEVDVPADYFAPSETDLDDMEEATPPPREPGEVSPIEREVLDGMRDCVEGLKAPPSVPSLGFVGSMGDDVVRHPCPPTERFPCCPAPGQTIAQWEQAMREWREREIASRAHLGIQAPPGMVTAPEGYYLRDGKLIPIIEHWREAARECRRIDRRNAAEDGHEKPLPF